MGLRFQILVFAAVVSAPTATAQQMVERTAPPGIAEPLSTVRNDPAGEPPSELKAESAVYLQRRLSVWQETDARKTLGEPRRRRDALEEGNLTGVILAFTDPTNRYREFELLFDRQSKTLRAVYIYPWHMTWSDCRELWGEDVNTTEVANGNLFRSYRGRHLDILMDKAGNVINLGVY